MSLFPIPSLNLQYSDNDLSQTANTNAYGGDSFFGHGGDANAVTAQIGAISDNDVMVSPDHFPWGPSPVADVDLQVSANTLTQTANTTAIGGFGLFGDGGDATATTVQVGSISDNDFMAS